MPRPWTTMTASAALHAAAIGALAALAGATASVVTPQPEARLRFVQVLPIPVEPPVRLPFVAREQLTLIDTPPAEVEAPAIPERIVARAEPAPPEPAPAAERPIEPARAKAAPAVSVGSFDTAGSTRAVEAARAVQPAGFDTTAVRTVETTTGATAVGAFDQGSGHARPGTARGKVVADAGFGAAGATGPGRGGAGAGVRGGFDVGSGSGGRGSGPAGSVKAVDFDTPQATPAALTIVRQAPTEVPLEILSKPTPAYTDDARARKIEGGVLLEVEFAATGEIRVLRVVRGLGHGLDESAVRAVRSMRFRPAQRNGQAVDIRTTVNIVFRLA